MRDPFLERQSLADTQHKTFQIIFGMMCMFSLFLSPREHVDDVAAMR